MRKNYHYKMRILLLILSSSFLVSCFDGGFKVIDSIDDAINSSEDVIPLPGNSGPRAPLDPESTYYIRADGGNHSECNGKADAAYPGSGTNQNCAWKHPFYAFSAKDSTSISAMPGGSTLIIKNGSYEMGLNGIPIADSNCYSGWSYDCFMKAIPSGTSTQPTRILGEEYGSGCSTKPELWGSSGSSKVLNLTNSNNVEIECLEVSDRSNCITHHRHGESSSPYRCGDGDNFASTGIKAIDSTNVVLRNVDVHGLAIRGISAGRISNWLLEKVKINANGWSGWDGDVGSDSSNSGTLYFKEVEIAWNGCTEDYPSTNIVACWGQQSGGYGDGLGTGLTSGKWIFEDLHVHHNTSDGIDLLYTNDDVEIIMTRVHAEGNAGNQLKTKGKALIENSLIIGNCGYFARNSSGLINGDNCRAMGNVLSIGLVNDKPTILKNNSIFSEGDAAILSACNASCDYSRISMELYNNIVVGYQDYHQSFDISAFHWHENTANSNDGLSVGITNTSKNIIYNVKNDFCLGGDNLCATDPLLNSTSNIDAINANPLPNSPAIGNANPDFTSSPDFYRNQRVVADIGAIQYNVLQTSIDLIDVTGYPMYDGSLASVRVVLQDGSIPSEDLYYAKWIVSENVFAILPPLNEFELGFYPQEVGTVEISVTLRYLADDSIFAHKTKTFQVVQ